MTLNIFSFTITITRRKVPLEKALHNEMVNKIFEENRRKVENYLRQY